MKKKLENLIWRQQHGGCGISGIPLVSLETLTSFPSTSLLLPFSHTSPSHLSSPAFSPPLPFPVPLGVASHRLPAAWGASWSPLDLCVQTGFSCCWLNTHWLSGAGEMPGTRKLLWGQLSQARNLPRSYVLPGLHSLYKLGYLSVESFKYMPWPCYK